MNIDPLQITLWKINCWHIPVSIFKKGEGQLGRLNLGLIFFLLYFPKMYNYLGVLYVSGNAQSRNMQRHVRFLFFKFPFINDHYNFI